jgi:4-hydroxybenzoate polyprenyltransferase
MKANERYIQRINVLEPKKDTIATFIKRSLTIRRKEFFVAELPIFLIPVLLCVGNWQVFININFWMGIIAGFLLFNIGDMINCYADRELDAIYKSHLSYAVSKLGKKNIIAQITLSGLIATILTAIIAINTKQLYLIPLTLVGAVVGLQYSIGPLHFKSRGVWQLFCLWGIIFWGPMLYIAIITNGFPSLILLALFAAYGFHQMGIILLNTAEDYTEDKQSGLNTIIVSLGLHRSMRFAVWLIVFSGLLIQIAFYCLFKMYGLPLYLYPGILIFTGAWLYIVVGFRKIVLKLEGKNEIDATEEIKKNGAKVPEWLKLGAYTSLAVAFIIFAYRLYLQHIF